ncbi:hypothetical protein [Erythrobacter sp. JK5]|uniref:hypothetical protein n=1 Tax=Erythrobacter sp. JK5 TaxID=2829500 RepID=UPI001BAD97A3|nr:hypothetical protein [Erythrobacter sp. JK5]QUL37527.1 hypothetical protein KDC96_14435 [Erythrobacter sp. JK5]
MKTRHGGLKYRTAVSGDVVVAEDTATSSVQAYRKRAIEDGTHRLEPFGHIDTRGGKIVGVSKTAESTGYVIKSERGGIVASRKSDPSWRLGLDQKTKAVTAQNRPSHAILKLGGGRLGFVDGQGLFRLDPMPSSAAGPLERSDYLCKEDKFDLGDDFAP